MHFIRMCGVMRCILLNKGRNLVESSLIKKHLAMIAAIVLLLGVTTPAFSDFINLPVKWSQPIGFNLSNEVIGVSIKSDHTTGALLADDFLSDGRPIVAIRWWGSYIGVDDERQVDIIGPFDIGFHLSVNSVPEKGPIVLHTSVNAQEYFVGRNEAGDAVYRYDMFLPTPFLEEAGVEYFLTIDKPTSENWGWQETPPPYPILNYEAFTSSHDGNWTVNLEKTGLAFELMTTVPEPSTMLLFGFGLIGLIFFRRKLKGS